MGDFRLCILKKQRLESSSVKDPCGWDKGWMVPDRGEAIQSKTMKTCVLSNCQTVSHELVMFLSGTQPGKPGS